MKTLIRLGFLCVVLVGFRTLPNANAFMSGSDNYEVQWTGANGSKLFGSYVVGSKNPGTPTRVEKITATLPYKITFSAPKNVLISAAGLTPNQGAVEIKIFKNGSECGKVAIVGSGSMGSKICQ